MARGSNPLVQPGQTGSRGISCRRVINRFVQLCPNTSGHRAEPGLLNKVRPSRLSSTNEVPNRRRVSQVRRGSRCRPCESSSPLHFAREAQTLNICSAHISTRYPVYLRLFSVQVVYRSNSGRSYYPKRFLTPSEGPLRFFTRRIRRNHRRLYDLRGWICL